MKGEDVTAAQTATGTDIENGAPRVPSIGAHQRSLPMRTSVPGDPDLAQLIEAEGHRQCKPINPVVNEARHRALTSRGVGELAPSELLAIRQLGPPRSA